LIVAISASLLGCDGAFRSHGPLVLYFAMRVLMRSLQPAATAPEACPAVRRALVTVVLVLGADRLRAGWHADTSAAAAVLTPFSTGLGRQPVIARKAALRGGNALPPFPAGFCGAPAVVFEISATDLAALTGDLALPLLVHRGKAAV
jgi:hypothetical protein